MTHTLDDEAGPASNAAGATWTRPDGVPFRVLRHLADEGCSTEGDVAKALGDHVSSLTVAKALRELEQSGFIRRKYVAITPTGLSQLEKTERRVAHRKAIVDKAAELANLVAATPTGPKAGEQ